jgi:hypothetical protein
MQPLILPTFAGREKAKSSTEKTQPVFYHLACLFDP